MSRFNKWKEKFLASLERDSGIDASQFDDPIASRTDWGPAKGGGANFRTHKMERVSDTRIKFKVSVGMTIFSGIFFTVGLAIAGFGGGLFFFWDMIREGIATEQVLMLLFGGVFMFAGGFMYFISTPPIFLTRKPMFFGKEEKIPAGM